MKKMQIKETSFISKMIDSIKAIEKYPEMAVKSNKEVFKYFITLILLFASIIAIVQTCMITKDLNFGIEYLKTQFPDINYANNELKVDSQEEIKINPKSLIDLIIVNTNEIDENTLQEYIKDVKDYDTAIVLLKDKALIKINADIVEYSYQNLQVGEINKEYIVNSFSGTNLLKVITSIFIISFISLFIVHFVDICIDVLALSFIGYITAILLRLRLRFIAVIKMVIHSLTLPLILEVLYYIVKSTLGFEVKYFDVVYITIAYIYIVSAILMVKSDLIKRGQELTRIVEEEERVKKELEEEKRRQEEEKQSEKEKKEDNKEQKEKKDKKKNNDDEQQPQGENA